MKYKQSHENFIVISTFTKPLSKEAIYLLAFSPWSKIAPQIYLMPAHHLASTWSPPLCMLPDALSDAHYIRNYFSDFVKT
ncbi:hypothetical protein IGI04_035435 [Brassica rapa subsp. trilocularis]|uniref:Uncharacterized protein n=1 Tax=Brassica rapa subsp. trilocularis TaxID=1813537 RepID=A0ABQ7LED2_BRACM|nr:hypothetical protein IGI04_035435 [Brassica rapa subsp. trilocularis]